MNPAILEGLNDQQREAVLHRDGPLLIVAGAGSGKTRVITHRVASLVARGLSPRRILAVTFTNKAAREMAGRVERMVPGSAVWVSTFHSFAARILRIDGESIGIPRDYTICDREDQLALVKRRMREAGIDVRQVRPEGVLSAISTWKNSGLGAAQALEVALDPFGQVAAEVFRSYEEDLRASHLLDFDDLLLRGRELLLHPHAGERWRERFEEVLVDEFQDTNKVQGDMVAALGSGRQNVSACGDPDQSIYSWRGADITNILEFERTFPGTRVVRLEQNYRSTGAILASASALISHNTQRIERELYSVGEEGALPELLCGASDSEEAERVAREMLRLRAEDGIDYGDMAILYRTNALSRSFEFGLRGFGIPYRVVGAVEFYARKEIKDLQAFLRLKANPSDTESFLRVVNLPARGIGARSQERLVRHARQVGAAPVQVLRDTEVGLRGPAARGAAQLAELLDWWLGLADDSIEGLLYALLDRLRYEEYLAETQGPSAADRWENVLALLADAAEFDGDSRQSGLQGWLEERTLVQDSDGLPSSGDGAVSLMTLHSAKGLEFRAVFLPCLEDDVIPHRRSVEERGLEEERRLLYVGMTRARERLFLSFAQQRFRFGRVEPTLPSRFLDEVQGTVHQETETDYRDGYGEAFDPLVEGLPDADADPALEGSYLVLDGEVEPDGPLFEIGEIVSHDDFGVGQVVEVSGHGVRTRLRVRFPSGEKRLSLGYARLRKVRPHE